MHNIQWKHQKTKKKRLSKAIWDKTLQKYHWVPYVFILYFWAWGLHLSVVYVPSMTPLEKTGQKILEISFCSLLLLRNWILSYLNLYRLYACCYSHTCCQFIHVSVLLYLQGLILYVSSIPTVSYNISDSYFKEFPHFWCVEFDGSIPFRTE
jgi:Ni,Fe-hydrogenase I cytochrome b subunit